MKILARLFICSFLSMLLASAIFWGIVGGLIGIIGSPVLMIFGWFYFPIVLGLHVIALGCWQQVFSRKPHGRIYFTVIGAVIAAALFSLIGIKEEGSEWLYTTGYALGASVAATASCLWISSQGPVEADQGNPPQ
jgi:hypothetical protein